MRPLLVTEPTARPPNLEPIDLGRAAILLDIDGTIIDMAPTPQSVVVPTPLLETLRELLALTGGALALVTGRVMANVDELFAPLKLPCIGGHGAEMRISGANPPQRKGAELSVALKKQVAAAVTVDPRIIVEDKGASFAVHYRLAPAQGTLVKNTIAAILDRTAAPQPEMLCGKAVIEIKPRDFNKGLAVRELMNIPPFAHRIPVFLGDDVTDESVLSVLPDLGGRGYSVGRRMEGTLGAFRSPQDVRDWLEELSGRAVTAAR